MYLRICISKALVRGRTPREGTARDPKDVGCVLHRLPMSRTLVGSCALFIVTRELGRDVRNIVGRERSIRMRWYGTTFGVELAVSL